MAPRESHTTTSRTGTHASSSWPTHRNRREMAEPAAPAPLITTRMSSILRPSTLAALISAASSTIAVPCWSSWNTGMPRSCSRRSISKHRGAEMSSRFTPPKTGATERTVSMIESASCVSRQRGHASTPANSLNSSALPSITGMAASGPMLPRPSTAEPSLTMATQLRLIVRLRA